MAYANSISRPRARLKKIARGVTVTRIRLSVGVVELFRFDGYGHAFPRHSHERLTFGVLGPGNGRIRVRGAEWQADRGCLLAIGADEPHSAEPSRGGGWSYRSFYPSAEVVAAALGSHCERSEAISSHRERGEAIYPRFDRPVIRDPELALAVERLHRRMERGSASPSDEERLLVLIGRLAARHGEGLPNPREDAAAGVVTRARAFLEANAGKPVRLHELAAVAGVSLFHLIRCFQREVGMPPHAWLTQLRANRAREMLLEGEAPAAVAYRCGFSDQAHLTRTFRSMLGVTPGTYARDMSRSDRATSAR